MPIPESEKDFPAFSQPRTGAQRRAPRLLVLALTLWCGVALAGTTEDYEAGLAAYQKGDLLTAMAPLKRAADEGHAPAQALYGDILDQAELNEDAAKYLQKAADQGNADGQYVLGVMYLSGEGVERSDAEANRLIRAAVAQGHALAINALAQAYIKGDPAFQAVENTSPEARDIVQKSAAAGYLPAIDALAAAYRDGGFGIAPDPKQAQEWMAKAADIRKVTIGKADK